MYGPTLRMPRAAQQIGRFDLPFRRTATGTGDQTGARLADQGLVQAGIGDRIAQRDVRERGGIAHEALLLAVDLRIEVDLGRAADLAAETELGVLRDVADARAAFAQRGRHGIRIVAQAGGDAQAGDDDAAHQKLSVDVNSPTRRSRAV